MLFFGYGSLINESSLRKTVPSGKIVGSGYLPGFKRVFDFKSPYRHNPETGVFSSVLNLQEADVTIAGALVEVSGKELDELYERERGYERIETKLLDGTTVSTFISLDRTPYRYVEGDPIQDEYLHICLAGTKNLGEQVHENFLDTTWLNEMTVREYLSK